jgi:hypothetical protein
MANFEYSALDFFETEVVDDPLHTRTKFVVAVAGLFEDSKYRLDRGKKVFFRRERFKRKSGVRIRSKPASDEDAESGFHRTVLVCSSSSDDADVVEHGLTAIGCAAREIDLELPGQALPEWIAKEVFERGFGPRSDVEDFTWASTGQVATLNVSNGVAARFTTGHPDDCDVAKKIGYSLKLNEMELDGLTRREVTPTA